ncbi:MAG: DUF192 domain-containing protein [Candidatus Nanoarchaeia archaeon]
MAKVHFPNGEILEVDVAKNFLSRLKGLSGCKEKKAMLFCFPVPGFWSFWMPAMHYPLSMLFLNSDGKVVDIKHAVPLSRDPKTWKIYVPCALCKYVLETPFNHNVSIGDKLKLEF